MISLPSIRSELRTIGDRVSAWRARTVLTFGTAAFLGALCVTGVLDALMRYGTAGRWVLALLVWGVLAAGFARVWRERRRTRSVEAIATSVERAFPLLDNRLINFLQFAAAADASPFTQAYVQAGIPGWESVRAEALRDPRQEKRATRALIGAVLLLAIPLLFLGRSYSVALARVAIPFLPIAPVTLTRILDVKPGDATVLQGAPVNFGVEVRGEPGHRVWLDLEPSDQPASTYTLGSLTGRTPAVFWHRIPKASGSIRYRFRAGDAPDTPWHQLLTRPPLAFAAIRLGVEPPPYTRLPTRPFDGLTQEVPVPEGSRIDWAVSMNQSVTSLVLRSGTNLIAFESASPTQWTAKVDDLVAGGAELLASAPAGDRAAQTIRLAFVPDRMPVIQILSPEGRPVLAPGQQPALVFAASDEYGLSEITVESVDPGADPKQPGSVLQRWDVSGRREQRTTWRDARSGVPDGQPRAYRVTATDQSSTTGDTRRTRSSVIVFNQPSAGELAKQREALEKAASGLLAQAISLQRANIDETVRLKPSVTNPVTTGWTERADVQATIRGKIRELLENPLNPLGRMESTIRTIYLEEMERVIPQLNGIPGTILASRPAAVDSALSMERKILRQLTLSDGAASDAKVDRRVTALSSQLQDLIRREEAVVKSIDALLVSRAAAGRPLIDQQDDLAADLTDFLAACRTESAEVRGHDAAFADVLLGLVTFATEIKVREDMVLAAGRLDEQKVDEAAPPAREALRKLKEIQARLDEIRAAEDEKEEADLLAAVVDARSRIEKMADIQRKLIESMEQVAEQKDKDTKDVDMLEEEYEALEQNLEEALLQIPTDLNIFMELNVANDIVEDVFSVFEEIQQAEGSENLTAGDVKERALAKREEYLEQMEEAKDRLDDLEKWLADKPDDMKITAEAFDREEMPQAGIALGALSTEAENLIGDLLKKNEEMSEEADDGAINTAVPDMVASDEVKEGDVTSFAAQGASGNETPDHKEQDGRSNVGRQGMSVGETAAGSGRIDEGDPNIEARRTQEPTQSGQVDVEGEDVKTKATGGGKLGTGKADAQGMEGGVKRMDSNEEGSGEGLDALMANRADALYAKASTQNIRLDALKVAAHHLRQADDAIAKGQISQLREHRKTAMVAMQKAKASIDAELVGSFSLDQKPSLVEGVVEGGPDAAPSAYRDLVSDYYKALNDAL